jgi:hypothetical protein
MRRHETTWAFAMLWSGSDGVDVLEHGQKASSRPVSFKEAVADLLKVKPPEKPNKKRGGPKKQLRINPFHQFVHPIS